MTPEMARNLELIAAAVLIALVLAVWLRRRLPAAQDRAELMMLRQVVQGMEVAATELVRGASVECLGNYRADPRRLIIEISTVTEADADRLIAEGGLDARLRDLLRRSAYPEHAIAEVGLTIRSAERLKREADALLQQDDLQRWAD